MTKTTKDETPGFRNYDEWDKGFSKYREYISDSYKYIRLGEEGSKYHSDNETLEETRKQFTPFLAALVAGAVKLQFVGDQDFYHNGEDIEILIRFKKDYTEIKKDEIAFNLMKDVILILEQQGHQFERIATSYAGK